MQDKYRAIFVPNTYYHVFNHAVGKEQLFLHPDNYHYFLHLFDKYICRVAHLFSYCLLPNHFHFFIAMKDMKEIQQQMEILTYPKRTEEDCCPLFLLQQFSNFFNAYTKAFNKQQERMGKLFMEPFNRRVINSPDYYTKIIHYIHANPIHHGFCKKPEEWIYSSYQQIINKNKWMQYEEVVNWFGSVSSYIEFHGQPIQRKF